MRLESITVAGVLRFDQAVTLDLRDLPPGLVAVVGENGSGKTSLVEAPIATLFRQFPSRAERELVDYAHGRDSYMEAVFQVDGRGRYRARVNLDGLKRTTDAVLEHTAADGTRTLLNDGKLKSYDEAVAGVFPPQAVLLASAVASQNRAGSFVSLDKRGRKDLFTALLGLDHYETLATTARLAAALHDTARVSLGAQRDVLARDGDDQVGEALADRQAALAGAQEVAAGTRLTLDAQRADGRARRAQLVDDAAAHRATTARLRELATEFAALMVRGEGETAQRATARTAAEREDQILVGNLTRQLAECDERIVNNQRVLDQAEAIRTAAAAHDEAQQALQALQARRATLSAELRSATQAVAAARARVVTASRAQEALARAREAAGLVATVPCGGRGEFAQCNFLAAAERARVSLPELEAAAATLDAADRDQAVASTREDALDTAIATCDQDMDRRRAVIAAAASLTKLLPNIETAVTRIAELQRDRASAEASTAELRAGVAARLEDALRTGAAAYAATQAAIDRVAADTARLTDEQRRTATAAAALEQLDRDLARADRAIEEAVATAARLEAEAGEVARRLEAWRASRARLDAVTTHLRAVEDDGREWALLAKAFGRDGLPVLEIDAAGPTVSAYCNDLLSVCFGPRFTVELITQAEKADGKGTKEVFELRVYDNLRGGDPRDLGDLSGGEQILVDEALKNALALFVNARHAGAIETCWRDETTGPLDPENARRYIEMLRRVQQLGGFRHVLYVSHNADAAALADTQVRLRDGRLTVHRPPFTEAA